MGRYFLIGSIPFGRGGQVMQMLRGSGVQPKGPRERIKDLSGGILGAALLESQVVRRADAGKCCQLLAAQTSRAALPAGNQPDFFGRNCSRLARRKSPSALAFAATARDYYLPYPGSTRHTRLIRGAPMVDAWTGRSTNQQIGYRPPNQ